MAGMSGGDDDDVISAINITPFVDIILVVLIIFMVTATYIVQSQIPIDLPKAASGQAEVSTTLAFQVTSEGQYAMDGEFLSLDAIAEQVRAQAGEDAELRAVIAADKKVEYGKVIDLVDTIKLNGIAKFALNIDRKEEQADGER
ncbi:biopolymer transporter ExbD [Lujinxingia vulgaris]|uniref:Biopolymer transporter ExbD n=1 Tax=Lujinxingia vulgaris TaxID=2600176 RepID=A0A5C6XAM4_9DELT|nr:biopolymer transporter ExbD [Lujinxingia vulgaris]TXD36295.1 biopolymer transporter ExbD [Lujinxingia vulgaris]